MTAPKKPHLLHWFPKDAAAWLARTARLSPEAYAAYDRLRCYAWLASTRGEPACSLPDDDEELANMSGMGQQWPRVAAKVRALFTSDGGRLLDVDLVAEWNFRLNRLARPDADLPPNVRSGSRAPSPETQPRGSRRLTLLARDGNRCVWCEATSQLQLDHIIPRALGGNDSDDNFQVLCVRCNTRKGSAEATHA